MVPVVVEAELRYGVLKSAKPQENLLKTEIFLGPFERVTFDSRCAEECASIRDELEKRGEIIGPNDLMIAAMAKAHDVALVTNNVREFECAPGLRAESWAVVELG